MAKIADTIIDDFVRTHALDCEHFKVLRPRLADGSVVVDRRRIDTDRQVAQYGIVIEKYERRGINVSFIGSRDGLIDSIVTCLLVQPILDAPWEGFLGEYFVTHTDQASGTIDIDYAAPYRGNGFYYFTHAFMKENAKKTWRHRPRKTKSTFNYEHWRSGVTKMLADCISTLPPGPITWDSVGQEDTIDPLEVHDILLCVCKEGYSCDNANTEKAGFRHSPFRTKLISMALAERERLSAISSENATRELVMGDEDLKIASIASDKAANALLMEEEASRAAEALRNAAKKSRNAKNKVRKKNKAQIKRFTEELSGLGIVDVPLQRLHVQPTGMRYDPLNNRSSGSNGPAPPPAIAREPIYEDEDSDSECDICMERPRTAIAFPCNHANLCSACVRACIRAKRFECIKCRCVLEGWWLQDEAVTLECC